MIKEDGLSEWIKGGVPELLADIIDDWYTRGLLGQFDHPFQHIELVGADASGIEFYMDWGDADINAAAVDLEDRLRRSGWSVEFTNSKLKLVKRRY